MADETDAVIVGAGLAGLAAAAEIADAGRRVIILEQEGGDFLGGQAWWSLGGLFMVDTPEQRRLLASVRDRVLADPRVKSLLTGIGPGPDPTGARGPALRELRRTARAVAAEIEPRLGPLLDRMA